MVGALSERLLEKGESRSYRDRDVLCHEGEESREAFLIVDGEIDAIGHGGAVLNTHSAGALVGEITTLVGGRRTATLQVRGQATVSVIDRATLTSAFEDEPAEAERILIEARRRTARTHVVRLLETEFGLDDPELVVDASRAATWLDLEPDETLFAEGDESDAVYLVLTGRLSVETLDAGRLAELGRGDLVGELGLMTARPRSASVRAVRASQLARIGGEDFRRLCATYPSLIAGIITRLTPREQTEALDGHRSRTVAVAVTTDVDADAVRGKMERALSAIGPTISESALTADERLAQPGLADAEPGTFGQIRVAELLHRNEVEYENIVVFVDGDYPHWSARAIGRADILIVLCSSNPSEPESTRISEILSRALPGVPTWLAPVHPEHVRVPSGTTALRQRFDVDEVHHLSTSGGEVKEAGLGRLARLGAGRGVAVVLSGGGGRGYAHLGVFRAMAETGIPVDRIVGVSMGSIVGAVVAQDVPADQRVRILEEQAADLLDYTLPVVSLIKGERISKTLANQFGAWNLEDLWIPFSCISTNMTTAEAVPHLAGPLNEAIRASIAIPGVLPPVAHEGDLLIDGGVLDNLPVGFARSDPSIRTVIASDVAPPRGPRARTDFGDSVSGWSVLRGRVGRSQDKYPGLLSILMRSMLVGSARAREEHLEQGSIDLYLALDLRGVGLLDFEEVESVADRGYESAIERISDFAMEMGLANPSQ